MDWSMLLFTAVEMIGMVAFALNGALVGLKYRLDIFGVILVAVTVSLGGGVVRDLIIGHIPPTMFRDYRYLLVAVVTALLVFLVAVLSHGRYHDYELKIESLANIFDALGLGAFTVAGVQAGINEGYADNAFLLVFLGLHSLPPGVHPAHCLRLRHRPGLRAPDAGYILSLEPPPRAVTKPARN